MPLAVVMNDIRAAASQIAGQVERTPCRHSRTLSDITGAEIYVKFENLQFTASFKDRGALNKLLSLSAEERKAGIIANSAGNHAQGVAYHAQNLAIPTTIVMPEGTPQVKITQTENFGAQVVIHGETVDEAGTHARQLSASQGLVLIHPFDDEKIIAGQGTVALEMLEQVPELDMIVVPIGGGGLISGCAIAAKAVKPEIRIFGAESDMYPSAHAARHGTAPPLGGSTIADGIAVKSPGRLTLPIIKEMVEDIILVREDEIEQAVDLYISIEKTVAEGAGAVSLAAVRARAELFRGKRVGLILSGGNIDTRLLSAILMRGLVRDGRIVRLRVVANDRPGALAALAASVGRLRGNILEVRHHRMFLDMPARLTELDLVVECRDREHVRELSAQIRAEGYEIRELSQDSALP